MKLPCSVKDCNELSYAKGFCKLHYQRFRRVGSPHVQRPCLRGTPEERFWRYVTPAGEDECWEWQGFRDKNGYGKMRTGDSNESAHRISFRIHNEGIDRSLMVLHRCNNPPCCNPKHLYQGDQIQNMKDRAESGNAPIGESHPNCKFSEEVILAVREAEGTYEQIGKVYNMSRSQVGNIKRGTQRKVGAAKSTDQFVPAKSKPRVCTWGNKLSQAIRKLTQEEADVIQLRLKNGELVKDIAAELGMHRTSISKIKMGTYFHKHRKENYEISNAKM